MKKNEINLKTVEELIKRNQLDKVITYIEEKRLNKEAALECFHHSSLIRRIINNYTFEELFESNLIKFIENGYIFSLMRFAYAKTRYSWLNCFFKNSDELIKVNKYVEENYNESIRSMITPERGGIKAYGEFKDDYYNCLDGIEKVLMEISNKSKGEVIINMLQTMPVLKWSIVEKYIEEFNLDQCDVIDILENRFEYFASSSLVDLEDIVSILDGFKQKYCKDIPVNILANLIKPLGVDVEDSTIEDKRFIYNKYIRERIMFANNRLNRYIELRHRALAFETDETRVNQIFNSLCGDLRLTSICNYMKTLFGDYKYPVLITQHMFNLTVDNRCYIDNILFPDKQLTADEVVKLAKRMNKDCINCVSDNPFALRAIQLETYSEEDMEKLRPYLAKRNFHEYFENNFIPFDFAMKYVVHADDLRLFTNNINKYTAEQLVAIVESDLYTSDKYNNQYIFKNFLERKDVTDELFAKVITIMGETNREEEYGMCKSESKASLKNILTLLN